MIATIPRHRLALAVLLIAAACDHYTVTLAGLHVKPEQVAALAGLALATGYALRTRRVPESRPLRPFLLFLVILLLASLLNAPDPGVGLRYTALVGLAASTAWLIYWLTDTPARLRAAVGLLIALGGAEAGIVGGSLVAGALGSPGGTQSGVGGVRIPYGTLWEPNLLGSYLAAAGILTLAALLAEPGRRRGRVLAGTLAAILVALVLSLARSALLGFGAGAGLVCAAAWGAARRPGGPLGTGPGARRAAVAGLAALVFLAGPAPLLVPQLMQTLLARGNLPALHTQADPSVQVRAEGAGQALAGLVAHPLLGNGAGSFGMGHQDDQGAPGWLSNLELHLWYDSGLLGLGAVVLGLGVVGRAAWRGALRTPGVATDLRAATLGLAGAGVTLLVAYQATEGSWLAFSWVYVGLLARAGRITTAAAPDAAIPPTAARPGSGNNHDPAASGPAVAEAAPAGAGGDRRHSAGRT